MDPDDPDACLTRLLDAFRDGNADAACDAIDDLQDWMANNGTLPADPRRHLYAEGQRNMRQRAYAVVLTVTGPQRLGTRPTHEQVALRDAITDAIRGLTLNPEPRRPDTEPGGADAS